MKAAETCAKPAPLIEKRSRKTGKNRKKTKIKNQQIINQTTTENKLK